MTTRILHFFPDNKMPTPEELSRKEELCREYRIDFAGDIDASEWPACHSQTLGKAKELGETKYSSYADEPNVSRSEPWKVERKSLALVLVEIASRYDHRSENTWRHACEPIIMGRLSSEVCWQVYSRYRAPPSQISKSANLPLVVIVGSEYGVPKLK